MNKDELKKHIVKVQQTMKLEKEKIKNWDSDYERYSYEYYRGVLDAYKFCWELSFNERYDDIYK